MPPASAQKLAYNKQFYQKNKDKKQLVDTVRSILEERKTQAKTLKKYGWSLTLVNRIRALNPTFRLVIEDTHGVKLEKLYRGKTALPPQRGGRPSATQPRASFHLSLFSGPQGDTRQGIRNIHYLGADRHPLGGGYRQARDGIQRCSEGHGRREARAR
jgi:hypothetical protein